MVLETKNIRYAHSDGHTDVCYLSDSRNIITCGSDGNVRIWNGCDDDDPTVDAVSEKILAVACSKDQFFVATNSNNVQAFKYPERVREKVILRFSAPVTHVSVSPSCKYIAAGSCDMEIQVLNTETNKITALTGHTAPILGVLLDPLDEYLVSSSCDGSVKVWEISTRSVIKTFTNMLPFKNDFFKAISLGRAAWKSVTGSVLAIPKDLEIIVYKRGTWEVSYKLKSNKIEKSLSIVLFSPCGNYIAGGSTGGEIVIWEIKHKSEVCHYKDQRKVGISGMAWHPDGSEITFSDRLGRFGVLTGINEEINKHVVPEESKDNFINDMADEMDTKALFDDDDDDEDNENCISIEKIKASYKNESEDEEPPGSPGSIETGRTPKEPVIPFTKRQSAFQPSSTPSNFEPRCLCFNTIGIVRYYDSDKTVDVQFHDTVFHHSLLMRSTSTCTMATLSSKVLCMATPSVEENLSKLTCVSLISSAGSKEWTVFMPENEEIVAIAAAESWVAAATNANNLRIFTQAGTQKQIVALPGPVVCITGYEQKILVVCHMGTGMLENQNQGFIIYKISKLRVRAETPFQPLPLFPKSVLKWAGFTDEGTPCTVDSEGLLRLLSHDYLHWEVVCDFRNQRKSPSDHYFVIGLSETYQNIRCVLCRNSFYPLVINTPTVLEIPFKLPLCALDTEKSTEEEVFWRFLFSIQTLGKRSADKTEYQDEISRFEQTLKETSLKLFAEASRNSDDVRAIDVATMMSRKPLEKAVKYALKMENMHLAEKVSGLNPVEWTNLCFEEDRYLTKNPAAFPSSSDPVFSGKSPVTVEKGNKPKSSQTDSVSGASQSSQTDSVNGASQSSQTNNVSRETQSSQTNKVSGEAVKEKPSGSSETPKASLMNPFKKVQPQKNEGPKGLKYFDTLMAKEAPKVSKGPVFLSRPLKLKLPSSKTKKPTFVQWFSTKKAQLSEEYPNISASELTKLGMKLYKEEMSGSGGGSEEKKESCEFSVTEPTKRVSEEESQSEAKRCKSLEDSL